MIRVAVVGATGFLGSELVRLLYGHPHAELTYLAGASSAGKDLGDVRPGFLGMGLNVRSVDVGEIAKSADVVFLALPHGESADIAAALIDGGRTVIDLGSDFRLRSAADVERFYGRGAPAPSLLASAVYCLPELTGPPPIGTQLVACPGCFATALNLLLAGVAGGVDSVDVFGITGSSGSGISPSTGVHHSLRGTNFTAYKPLRHQHEGEVSQMQKDLGHEITFRFVPHSAPLVRGIHLTAVLSAGIDLVGGKLNGRYEHCDGVTVVPGPVALGSVVGTNRVLIGYEGHDDSTAVFCAIDNLLKGGSGQAIQIFNLMNGFGEFEGIPMVAAWP